MAAYYPNNVTTDHIQQYLDENKSLILKIVESQNSGKMSECAENQARLQRNLMYLAAIADSHPPPNIHPQFSSSGVMQPGAQYAHHQQITPQALATMRSSMLYPQQPFSALQQQQQQLGASSGGGTGFNILHSEASHSGIGRSVFGVGGGGFPEFAHASTGMSSGSKNDVGSATSSEGRGASSLSGPGGDNGETLYLKAADHEGN
ncbi:hypothetical protein ACJRO7_032725 [Eucalyptus globulus]|uniref:SS18 N-terminal domain-containing protein n=1 Tax=Eucalyptus globulus TaxID=34317 RepID=A0ABD3JN14_EUCGL